MPNIVDIDDTLLRNGTTPIRKVIEYVNRLDEPVYIVTGRDSSQREATARALREAGVRYNRLIMHNEGDGEVNAWKGSVATAIGNVDLAIDNNPNARAAYREAGVRRVLDPADI